MSLDYTYRKRSLLLHQIFEEQASKTPLRMAVEHIENGTRVTYKELDQLAKQLAIVLIDHGVKPGHIVAICLPRGVRQYVAMLAILKAGGAYVPIDPEIPAERISYILNDSGARLALISQHDGRHKFPEHCRPIVLPADLNHTEPRQSEDRLRNVSAPSEDDLCYLIYTSGTSGTPKGVCISHRNARTFVSALMQVYGVRETDRVLQGFSIAFDASVEEIWLAFSVGATLVVGTLECMRTVDELPDRLRDFDITVFSTVPTLLRIMPRKEIPKLRLLITGGEAARADIVEKWAVPGRKILNGYGPTECTVTATYTWCVPGAPITIGKPLPGYGAVVLDANLLDAPDGVEGELCLFGPAVSA